MGSASQGKRTRMLTGKQKRYLRSLGAVMEPIVQVGKGGVVDNLIQQVDDALEARELIKVKVLNNCLEDLNEVAEEIARETKAEIAQTIGHTILLYRPSQKNRQIELPR